MYETTWHLEHVSKTTQEGEVNGAVDRWVGLARTAGHESRHRNSHESWCLLLLYIFQVLNNKNVSFKCPL